LPGGVRSAGLPPPKRCRAPLATAIQNRTGFRSVTGLVRERANVKLNCYSSAFDFQISTFPISAFVSVRLTASPGRLICLSVPGPSPDCFARRCNPV
jgi:hypothetical protein